MIFEGQPVLKCELIKLRPLEEEDYHQLYSVASDPQIWSQHPDNLRYQEENFITFFNAAMDSKGALILIDNKTQHVIGSSRFNAYDPIERSVEIGWTFLARSHWGGQYNREMKRLMLQHAFKYVDRVLFVIGSENIRSQKAIEKIGGTQCGTRPGNDKNMNLVYEVSQEKWLK